MAAGPPLRVEGSIARQDQSIAMLWHAAGSGGKAVLARCAVHLSSLRREGGVAPRWLPTTLGAAVKGTHGLCILKVRKRLLHEILVLDLL